MKKFFLVSFGVLSPTLAYAALAGTQNLLRSLSEVVRFSTILLAGIALLVFFWGLLKFLFKIGGDAKAAEEGKTFMIWGTIALFVMVSIWGLVRFIQNELLPGGASSTIVAPPIPSFRQ